MYRLNNAMYIWNEKKNLEYRFKITANVVDKSEWHNVFTSFADDIH